jgi:pimeloyl-ACP methyl ester carboxylesterase
VHLELISKYPDNKIHGKHLLFIHGVWHGAWCWDKYFLSYFAQKGYCAHALSLRGHGKSDGKKSFFWTRINDYVTDVIQVVSSLPEKPVVIGHSMGGFVVQKYLETEYAPAGILLASPPPQGMFGALYRIAKRHPLLFLKSNLTMNTKILVSKPEHVRESLFCNQTDEKIIEECTAMLGNEAFMACLDMVIFNLPKPSRVSTPLLVLGAEHDFIFKAKEINATISAFKADTCTFKNMGHDMMLEKGWQDVADTMIGWLKGKNI